MGIVNNVLAGASGNQGYNLQRSLRFRSSASAYLNRTPASASNRKTWTLSTWVKRGALGAANALMSSYTSASDTNYSALLISSDNTIYFGGQATDWMRTTAVYRDPAAWYHIVFALDTTQATASNRWKLYVNGSQVTSFSTANYPAQNADLAINQAGLTRIAYDAQATYPFDGYLTEVNFIDGQALTPSSFGSTNAVTGVWQPKKYAGTYGTNGFYLPFTDNSALTTSTNVGLGKDFSGNANYWATNNISITAGSTYDSMTDVPTLTSTTAANYCTANPLNTHAVITTSAGNLNTTYAGGAYQAYGTGTIGVTTGKFYWEVTVNTIGATGVGIFQAAGQVLGTEGTNNTFNSASSYIYFLDGKKYNNSATGVSYGAAYTTGDIIGVAFDADNGTLTFYKNNSSQGTAYTGLTATPYLPSFTCYSGSNLSFNFGQRPFVYTAPTGFLPLNTYNI